MSLNHSRWNLLPPAPERYLDSTADFPRLIAQLLYNRGLKDPSQLQLFLAADENLSADPLLLPDMQSAVARVYRAILGGEKIAVYGDYDADGITGTALLVQGLSRLGGQVVPYIPNRMAEGYGLKATVLKGLFQQGITLVITVDCGVTAIAQVEKARRLGLDIVITDHHTPLAEIPPAVSVVDPKLPGSSYPFTELAGVGVAFKLLEALFTGLGKGEQLGELMDLVAIGTVADMSPLLGENRYLVKRGLEVINTRPRTGVRELMAQLGLDSGSLSAEAISWVLAPRLNAAGRVAHAMSSYDLLMTDSAEEAQRLSLWLEEKNAERQKLTASAHTRAREQVLAQGISPLLVVSDRDYPAGVSGLVASRLAEEFYRPAVVIKTGERVSSASCRSIPEFNMIAAITRCSQLLSEFGGHSMAAGFRLPTRNLPQLKQQLSSLAAAELEGVDLYPRLDVDAEAGLVELGGDTFRLIGELAPFGRGNPLPAFLSRRVEVLECRTMGNNGGHLRMKLRQGDSVWDGVAFRWGDCLAEVTPCLDIVYNLELDRWGGKERLRLNILDFVPAQSV
ncbi:single-stranded-DNA-specific exonuclease RecJ [Chloroflexota bacterium]